jgi:hypothetical protein
MGTQQQDAEQLLERIRQLEASGAGREAPNHADIRHSNFTAETVNTSGRDMYVIQLEEQVRFLEGLDRAHKMRRTYFWLSALCFIAAMAVGLFAGSQISHLVSSTATEASALDAFRRYITIILVAGGLETASIAFLILGLLSRPPRTR